MRQNPFQFSQSKPTTKKGYKPFAPGPNPDLPDFIRRHSTPYIPATDQYDVRAFDRDLAVHKHNKLYTMHMYWSKKDPASICEYIKHFTKPGDVVLDPFAGSGTTGCASVVTGRNVILIDISASACFLAHHYCALATKDEVKDSLALLLGQGREKLINALYDTRCDRCGGPALTEFVVWSDSYQCPNCAEIVALYDCPEVQVSFPDGSKKKKRVCPVCLANSGGVLHSRFTISTRTRKFEEKAVACKYLCVGSCRPKGKLRFHNDSNRTARKYFHQYDLPRALSVKREQIDAWYPKRTMMDVPKKQEVWGIKWRAGSANFRTVADLFTNRNLKALAELRRVPKDTNLSVSPLLFLTWILHKCSNLMGYGSDGVGRIGVGTYYVPPIRMEVRPTKYIDQAKRQLLAHFEIKSEYLEQGNFCISVESNQDAFKKVPESCVDYIFTDPPYLNIEVQYGEMNFLWDAWLDLPSSIKDEITLNPIHNHSWDQAETLLRNSLFEMYRVLKPGRWISICYHDTSEANWTMLQRGLLDAGFQIHSVTCFDPRSKSRKANTAEKIVKSDLVLNCRKPRVGDYKGDSNGSEVGQISHRVREILIETLSTIGGLPRDRLWDIVLKRLLARGHMAEHRFEDILKEVAVKSESSRWFLKEELESVSESDLKNEEAAGSALARFALLRCMGVPVAIAAELALQPGLSLDTDEDAIEKHIRKISFKGIDTKDFRLGGRLKGCEFYDCLFFYLTRFLKGRAAGKTPRRNLAEFLEEYLVRFRDGDKWLYRPPTDAEAESLRKSRQSGLGRRIRQYVAYLKGEGDFPKERIPDVKTLVAWLKHCANFGLAEAGVALYEKGGLMGQLSRLSDDERYDAEDYYTQCRRNAPRSEALDEVEDIDEENGEEVDE